MIKTWQQRYNEACLDPVAGERSSRELISEAKLAEIDELRAANARLWLEREEPHRTIQDYLYECNSLEQERDELLAKLAALEQEANEEDALRERLSGLLTKSVNAIRGEPAELSLHSWHDLPELCNGLVEKLAELESLYASPTCTSDEWLANCPQSVRDLADKIKAGAAPVPEGWQPIETAPKDGLPFRAYSKDLIDLDFNPNGSVECCWDGAEFAGCVWDGQQDAWYGKAISPTHWMLLPAAPKEQTP